MTEKGKRKKGARSREQMSDSLENHADWKGLFFPSPCSFFPSSG
jgi:hypothetical protein